MELGKTQTLCVARQADFGVYLTDPEEKDGAEVLLPKKQVPQGTKIGDEITVFLYRDSADRPIATVNRPQLERDGVALLPVRETTKIGAFLDWGLEKDLLLPFAEQRGKVRAGDEVLVALYEDKSGRLAATMNVYPYLSTRPPYMPGDAVRGRVYETSRNFGVFVAVDDKYSALIPKHDAQGTYTPGEVLDLRVVLVREDGKLVVTAKQPVNRQMDADAARILEAMQARGGALPFDDKASPALIEETFGISKAAFKRAVGRLMKEEKIRKGDGKLTLL